MITYLFKCDKCGNTFEKRLEMGERNRPTLEPCPSCLTESIYRVPGYGGFSVPEGGCGNAKNGYSSYHGDSENFKAGRKIYR